MISSEQNRFAMFLAYGTAIALGFREDREQ
jgi:hypothetical protein